MIRIEINPDYREMLDASDLSLDESLFDIPGGMVAGSHTGRSIVPHTLTLPDASTRSVYIKREQRLGLSAVIKRLLTGRSPVHSSRTEWQACNAFRANDIPAVGALALVEDVRCSVVIRTALVLDAAGGTHLAGWARRLAGTQTSTNAALKHNIARAVGALAGRLHGADFTDPDLTAKHIYLKPDGKQCSIELIDLERVTRSSDASDHTRDLMHLLGSLPAGTAGRTDLMRAAWSYLGCTRTCDRPARKRHIRDLLSRIGVDTVRNVLASQPWNIPDDVPDPDEEALVAVDNLHVNYRHTRILHQHKLDSLPALTTMSSGTSLHKPNLGRRERIHFTLDRGGQPAGYYLKRIINPGPGQQWDRIKTGTIFNGSLYNERRMIARLETAGIPTLRLVAFGQQMAGPWEQVSVLVTEEIYGQSLETLAADPDSEPMRNHTLRRTIARQLGAMIGHFHSCGFCHRDLYFAHVLLTYNSDHQPVLRLIDLQRAFRVRRRHRRWRIKDIASLAYSAAGVSRTDQMRCMCAYLGRRHLEQKDKQYIYKILQKVQRIRRHDRNRARTRASMSTHLH